jgi:hypothetical protein
VWREPGFSENYLDFRRAKWQKGEEKYIFTNFTFAFFTEFY